MIEHPFAGYLQALGRGPGRSRDLAADEAVEAMRMMVAGEVEPVQLGAFLMIKRYRQETPEEIAGFVRAARAFVARPGTRPRVDLDWPSYADRHRQLPWFTLAALLLAENGVRVLMHGIAGLSGGFVSTPQALGALGVLPCRSAEEAAHRLDTETFAYLGLAELCPPLDRLFGLKPLLGVRTPVHSLARALNPFAAPCQLQGVFHPPYRELHQRAALLLGQPHAAIFKGGGGEAQRNPEKPCAVATVNGDRAGEAEWPALLPAAGHRWREEPPDPARIAALWRGAIDDPVPVAAVTGSAALALKLLGRAATSEAAQALAEAMWRARPRKRYGAAAAA